jgi:hypothetical protein
MDSHTNSIILKKLLFITALAFIAISVSAHNPNTASVIISPINGVWVAQFTISQEGANYALKIYYADKDLSSISETDYKKLYIDYLRKKISLVVDNKKIALSSGGIKLGNHQTDIKLLLPDFPRNYNVVDLRIPMFEENGQQHTVVKFLDKKKSIRKVMNQSNEFEISFENSDTGFIENKNSEIKSKKVIYVLSAVLLIATGVYFFKKRNKTITGRVDGREP